jgi:hypothetical protein
MPISSDCTARSLSERMMSVGVVSLTPWVALNRLRAIARCPCDCRFPVFNQCLRAWFKKKSSAGCCPP